MKRFHIITQEVVERVYVIDADEEKEAIQLVRGNEVEAYGVYHGDEEITLVRVEKQV